MKAKHLTKVSGLRRAACFAASLILVSLSLANCTRDPIDPVGQILSDAASSVQQILQSAESAGNGVVIAASSAVQQDIDEATSAFGDQLTKGLNQVDAITKTQTDDIMQYTKQLAGTTKDVLTQVTNNASDLALQIGLGTNLPIVRSYEPHNTTAAQAAKNGGVTLVLTGTFPRADQPGYAPTAKVNGETIPNAITGNQTNSLTFHIPASAFSRSSGLPSPIIEADLPFSSGHLFNQRIVPGVFRFTVVTLPDSPTLSLTLTTTTPGTSQSRVHPVTTKTEYLSSLNCHTATYTQVVGPSQPGWTIDPTSVQQHETNGYPKGNSGTYVLPYASAAGQSSLTLTATTYPDPLCTFATPMGGRLNFYFTYNELEPVVGSPTVTTQSLKLDWGDAPSYPVPEPPGTWQLDAVLFDGTHITAPPTQTGNPWVQVTDLGTRVAIRTGNLTSIDLSNVNVVP